MSEEKAKYKTSDVSSATSKVSAVESKRTAYEKLLCVLRAVEDGPVDGVSNSDIAHVTGEVPSTVSRILEVLVKDSRVRVVIVDEHPPRKLFVPGDRACLTSHLLQLNKRAHTNLREAEATQDMVQSALGILDSAARSTR